MKPTSLSATLHVMWVSLLTLGIPTAIAIPVTFQVDLSIQKSVGRFDPAQDIVEVRGSFNIWEGGSTMDPQAAEPAIYELEVDVPDDPGTNVPYKFVIVDSNGIVTWESDVGEGQTNRTFLLEEDAQTLTVAFFDNLDTDPGAGIDVTFQVDMAARVQEETFDPEFDFVEVRGPFNSWAEGDVMERVAPESTLYSLTTKVEFFPTGTEIPYKYIINGSEWESDANRTFKLEDTAQELPTRFFNDVEPANLEISVPTISPVNAGSFTITWKNPSAVLQGTPDLASGQWDTIPNPGGETTLSLSTDLADTLFFRLILP